MKIIIDAFGGDNAPLEIIKGSALAVKDLGAEIILTGNEAEIKRVASENNISLENIQIEDCDEVITMEDEPIAVRKTKKNSSMAVGFRLLNEGKGDAFISCGNSGALCVGATTIAGRIKGIKRTAFAPVLPSNSGFFMLLDGGANVDARPEMLYQFALMGSVYMERVMPFIWKELWESRIPASVLQMSARRNTRATTFTVKPSSFCPIATLIL